MKTNEMKSGNARKMYEQPEINVVDFNSEHAILTLSGGGDNSESEEGEF